MIDDGAPSEAAYGRIRAAHHVSVPTIFNPVIDIFDHWAQEDPTARALESLSHDSTIVDSQTAAELACKSRQAARALLHLGVRKGDFVFIMLPRVSAWYFAMLGVMRIGAVAMPAPNLLTPKDIAYRLRRGRALTVITDRVGATKVEESGNEQSLERKICWSVNGSSPPGWTDFAKALEAAGDGPTPEQPTRATDPLLVYFTSGTVSYPKMVLHAQSYALGHVGTARYWQNLRAGDRHWTVSDTGWAKAAWGSLFGQWHEKATVVQVALDRADPKLVLSVLAKRQITSFCAPPTLYRQLVLCDLRSYDFSALRHCTSAGEPLNPEVIRAWRDGTGGLTIYDGYGQSETTLVVANYPFLPVRPGSMGKPVPGYDVDILDDDGRRAESGELGSIAVKSSPHPVGLFTGYFEEPEATGERFRSGWYYTGDKGRRDPEGYIWFEGREDDVITSAAYRIGPFEVESALLEHPAVAEAGVVGKPDLERTEIVCAFIILTDGHQPSQNLTRELQDYVKTATAPYKYPREIVYVNELPKTISGKIRRAELRQWLRQGPPLGVVREPKRHDDE